MSRIIYRYINEGKGGTLDFGFGASSHVGTWRCYTCVGVYFPIGKYKCFCAHINTWIETGGAPSYLASEEEGRSLKDVTLNRLQNEAKREEWKPTDADASRMVLVCPKMEDLREDVKDKRPVGFYVLQAIQEFLDLGQDLVSKCDTEAQGFVIDRERTNVMRIARSHHPTTGYLDAQNPSQLYYPSPQGKEQWAYSVLRK